MAAKAHGYGRREGKVGEKRIRIKLESAYFQRKLTGVSKREKKEEISRIICPQKISPDRERIERIGKQRRHGSARVSGGGGAMKTTTLTSGAHLSAAERERRAAARRTGPDWAEEREKRGFGPAFGPKPKEDF